MWEFHGVQFDSSKGIETKHNETKDLGSELGAPSSAQKSIFNLLQLAGMEREREETGREE